MNHLITLESGQTGGLSMLAMLGIYAVFIVALYFIFFRPQSKKKKKEAEMRKNAQVGDEITTIGGICGRIIAVKDETDSVVIETGSDKAKLRVTPFTRTTPPRKSSMGIERPRTAYTGDKDHQGGCEVFLC